LALLEAFLALRFSISQRLLADQSGLMTGGIEDALAVDDERMLISFQDLGIWGDGDATFF
jgi:hypothetical protein